MKKGDINTGIQSHECLSSCIGNILHKKYPSITGNEIIINGRGFRVLYREQPVQLMTEMFGANFIFMKKYGIGFESCKLANGDEPEKHLNNLLADGLNVILKVNANTLVHNRIYKQVDEAPHYINVIGEKNNKYEIIDGYVPTMEASSFKGEIEKKVLFEAWKQYGNRAYIVYDNFSLDEELIFRETMIELYNSINNYYNSRKKKELVYGEAAILKFIDSVRFGISREEAKMLNYQLKIWGFLSVKQMIIELLSNQNIFNDIVNQYKNIINKWNKLSLLILKVSISQRKETINELVNQMRNCVEEEEELLKNIQLIIQKNYLDVE